MDDSFSSTGVFQQFSTTELLFVAYCLLLIPIYWFFGVYQVVARYIDIHSLRLLCSLTFAHATIGTVLLVFLNFDLSHQVIVNQALAFCSTGIGFRLFAQWIFQSRKGENHREPVKRVLIFEVGEHEVQVANALDKEPGIEFVGYVDSLELKSNRVLQGAKIFDLGNIENVIKTLKITDVFISSARLKFQTFGSLLSKLQETGVSVRPLPIIRDMFFHDSDGKFMRKMDIVDLIDRQEATPVAKLMARDTFGKSVLISGAGGSIGSELCEKVLAEMPKKIALLEQNEFALYNTFNRLTKQRNASSQHHSVEIVPILGSTSDQEGTKRALKTHDIDTVYHAAAYKHVDLVEKNFFEGIKNNFLGTSNFVRAAIDSQVSKFVLVSTDKAVRPTSCMVRVSVWRRCACRPALEARQRLPLRLFVLAMFWNHPDL